MRLRKNYVALGNRACRRPFRPPFPIRDKFLGLCPIQQRRYECAWLLAQTGRKVTPDLAPELLNLLPALGMRSPNAIENRIEEAAVASRDRDITGGDGPFDGLLCFGGEQLDASHEYAGHLCRRRLYFQREHGINRASR